MRKRGTSSATSNEIAVEREDEVAVAVDGKMRKRQLQLNLKLPWTENAETGHLQLNLKLPRTKRKCGSGATSIEVEVAVDRQARKRGNFNGNFN